MQEQTRDLAKRAALAVLPWAAGLVVLLTFTGLVPCCNFLVFPLAALGLGYLIAARLDLSPTPETKQSVALTIGLTVGAGATIAALIMQGITLGFVAPLGFSSSRSTTNLLASSLGLGISLIITMLVTVIGGLLFGAIFGILGGYLALERRLPRESYY